MQITQVSNSTERQKPTYDLENFAYATVERLCSTF